MADKGRRSEPVFFIYDHNMLKKEEDDLKDAILYFSQEHVSADDQCALCGQLMGMTEFLGSTLCQSNPQLFKFEYEKFALKRRGSYSFALQSNNFTPDSLLINQLRVLYATFVTFHGSVDSVRLRYKDSHDGFLKELADIWRTILQVSGVSLTTNLALTFHALPYLQLPQRGSHLFLQASHLLQSSQRRPYVLAGAIFYKNSVLSTQLSPTLTRQLTFLQNQMPHVARTVEFDLPVGCRIITVFLHDDELNEISPLDIQARRHCKLTNFTAKRDSENKVGLDRPQPGKKRNLSRRLTCPDLGSPTPKQSASQAGETTLQTFLTNEKRRSMYRREADVVSVDHKPWSKERRTKISLSHVPIVECRSGESSAECDENSGGHVDHSYSDETYKQIEMNTKFHASENESSEETTTDEESQSADSAKAPSDNVTESVKKFSEQVKDVTKSHEHVISDKTHVGNCNDQILGGQLAHTHSGKSKVQSNGETSNEGPSISDLEDESDKDAVTEGSNSSKRNSVKETLSSIESSKVSLEDGRLDCVSYSTSSDSVRESRFYDKLPDDETATVRHGSSHSIHNHIADVHIDAMSSSENSTELRKHIVEQAVKGGGKRFEHGIADGTAKIQMDQIERNCENDDSSRKTENITGTVNLGNVGTNKHTATFTDVKLHRDNAIGDDEKGSLSSEHSRPTSQKFIRKETNAQVTEMDGAIEHQSLSVRQESQPTSRWSTDMKRKETNSAVYNDKDMVDQSTEYKDFSAIDNLQETAVLESDLETEDESVIVEHFTPCINCLEAASLPGNQMAGSTVVKCAQCLLKPKIINKDGVQQEVIDFSQNPEAGEESEIQTDVEIEMKYLQPNQSKGVEGVTTASSSFSSSVSTDSTISRYWSTEMDGLNDVTLYVQCHSDISLLLLMENPEHYEEDLLHSLWKGSLAHLADLDYYIKECMEGEDLGGVNLYTYARFDPFTGKLQGNIDEDLSSKQEEDHLNQMLGSLHSEFQHRHCLTDVTLRSQVSSCYGHHNHVEETYFHPTGQQRFASGLPIPKDSVYSLDTVAQQRLTRDKKMPIL